MTGEEPKLTTTTIGAYDQVQLRSAYKSVLMGVGMMCVMHIYFNFRKPSMTSTPSFLRAHARRLTAAAALVLLTGVLAACGGGSGGSAPTTPTPPTTTPTNPGTPTDPAVKPEMRCAP